MRKGTNESLIEALSYYSLPELPEADDKSSIWIRAIARVLKSNGVEYYAGIVKDDNLENKIVKDFGPVFQIVEIKEIYPIEYLKEGYLPRLENEKKETYIKYLTSIYGAFDASDMSVKDLKKEVVKVAIKAQKASK